MTGDAQAALAGCIETIEASYEFMLAYAAQGRDSEDARTSPSIRQTLSDLSATAGEIAERARAAINSASRENAGGLENYCRVLEQDAEKAGAAINLVLAVPSIGSQLVDNLNASIHLRALLTDIFLIDEALKAIRRSA